MCKGFAVSEIISVNIGVVSCIIKRDNQYLVTIDNCISGYVPLDHPVKEYFIGQKIYFPHFKNDGIALVNYTNGGSNWLPARIAISIHGEVIVDKIRYKFTELTFKQFADLSKNIGEDFLYRGYASITSPPVPSGYGLYLNSQFAEHNYEVIKKVMADTTKEQLVDIAYSYSRELGYSLVYIQPTRFTQKYCEQKGIPTEIN